MKKRLSIDSDENFYVKRLKELKDIAEKRNYELSLEIAGLKVSRDSYKFTAEHFVSRMNYWKEKLKAIDERYLND